jgi:hypothetical protein
MNRPSEVSADRPPLADLPERLTRYFWDQRGRHLSPARNRSTVLQRLLEVGGWDAARWLLRNVPHEELTGFIASRRGRGLSPKRLRFWALVLDLPGSDVDRWIDEGRANPWARRTRR